MIKLFLSLICASCSEHLWTFGHAWGPFWPSQLGNACRLQREGVLVSTVQCKGATRVTQLKINAHNFFQNNQVEKVSSSVYSVHLEFVSVYCQVKCNGETFSAFPLFPQRQTASSPYLGMFAEPLVSSRTTVDSAGSLACLGIVPLSHWQVAFACVNTGLSWWQLTLPSVTASPEENGTSALSQQQVHFALSERKFREMGRFCVSSTWLPAYTHVGPEACTVPPGAAFSVSNLGHTWCSPHPGDTHRPCALSPIFCEDHIVDSGKDMDGNIPLCLGFPSILNC